MPRSAAALCRLAVSSAPADTPDAQLLRAFVASGGDDAFAELVRRHGPMVLGVCRRVLQDWHHAEDAFQATFLVLARKAASVVPREAVGNWLFGVAVRTARRVRAVNARRSDREKSGQDMRQFRTEPMDATQEREALAILDEEMSRLPEKYRLPLVLCDLESRPRREVAKQLELPEGTLSSRLATARKLLARRLARRGVSLSASALATVLSRNAASAGLPGALAVSTSKAAVLCATTGRVAADLVSARVAATADAPQPIAAISPYVTSWPPADHETCPGRLPRGKIRGRGRNCRLTWHPAGREAACSRHSGAGRMRQMPRAGAACT
jgi:RNA polymerase sigma factor (sigma-70 family)